MRYLIIGINLLLGLVLAAASCTIDEPPIQKVRFVYKNTTSQQIKMNLFNSVDTNPFKVYLLSPSDSVAVDLVGDPFVNAWHFRNDVRESGDSLIVIFEGEKCLSHTSRYQTGTFDFRNYDNYTPELVKRSKFTLYYTFTEEHYAQAQPCE
jgi:hypothetical protein